MGECGPIFKTLSPENSKLYRFFQSLKYITMAVAVLVLMSQSWDMPASRLEQIVITLQFTLKLKSMFLVNKLVKKIVKTRG